MKNNIITIVLFLLIGTSVFGQKYYTKTGEISFFSGTAIENIEAVSNSASTVIDMETGKLQWAVLIKSFVFEKALMQEHFNENYMESSKYPKAKFSGTINNLSAINLKKDGTYNAEVKGTLDIHGVEKEIAVNAIFIVKNGAISATSDFKVLVADYGIQIPSVVKDNIAKEIEIKIKANYEALN
jgi:polyisoprenoid-binding protein YceI